MVLTARQEDILQKAVFEYIDRAQPVSSSWLEARYDMPLSPATIRSELSYLCQEGYLEQPHTSAGRVPTDRGYRFFVDEVLPAQSPEGIQAGPPESSKAGFGGERNIRDYVEFAQTISRNLTEASSSLTIVYFPQKSFFWKDGWELVLRAPELEGREQIGSFT